MSELPIIFSLTLVGSLVRMSVDLTLKWAAPKVSSVAASPDRSWGASAGPADPVFRCGFILAADGAIVLALVSALPGALGLQRTGLAFALLCVGGLIGEIANTRLTPVAARDGNDELAGTRRPASRALALASMVALNLAVAVLSSRQSLIDIVPAHDAGADAHAAQELAPLVVVARRRSDLLDDRDAY